LLDLFVCFFLKKKIAVFLLSMEAVWIFFIQFFS
jgi:hypothetical protein